jgi:MinD-like ATPase involved in chromosome partitioning or flagellar assembly
VDSSSSPRPPRKHATRKPHPDDLRLVTIQSHKGGVGKTTLAVALAAALAKAGKSVCLVDLDLLAPAAAEMLDFREGRLGIADFLFGARDGFHDPAKPVEPVEARAVCHEAPLPWPGAHDLTIRLVPGWADFELARRAQPYILAVARSGLLEARLEQLLKRLNEAYAGTIFVLDVPPSLFGLAAAARELIWRHHGVLVHVCTPNRPDLTGSQRMLNALYDEWAERDGKERPRKSRSPKGIFAAFVLNRWQREFSHLGPRRAVERIVARAGMGSGGQEATDPTRVGLAARTLQRFHEVAAVPESEELWRLSSVAMAPDKAAPTLEKLLGKEIPDFAGGVLRYFRRAGM